MLRKYSMLWFLFQLLVEINCQNFKPKPRISHTATLIDNKIYFVGGEYYNDTSNFVGNEFFYLDVSVSFNTNQEISWGDLSNIYNVPQHSDAASVKAGANNNTLFLYGGEIPTSNTTNNAMELVYTFDPQNNSWSAQNNIAGGNNIIRKGLLEGIVDYNGRMYLWGGRFNQSTDVNDMLILNTISLSWNKGSTIGAPSPRQDYGAVFLPDKTIIYFGGYNYDNNMELELNSIYIYNTIDDTWSTKDTTGNAPSKRDGFSAVLNSNGQRVIIFGGTSRISNNNFQPGDSLYVLDLTANYEWSTPKVTGKIPTSRLYHRANVIKNYMIISFGQNYDPSVESDILLLDISNDHEYKWTNIFDPTSIQSSDKPLNYKPVMIGVTIVGSLFGCVLISIGGFFLYRWNENKKNVLPTPGSVR